MPTSVEATPAAFDAFLATLRGKWGEVPSTAQGRIQSSDLLAMSDADLGQFWEACFADNAAGPQWSNRGWYHHLYADLMRTGPAVLDVGCGFGLSTVHFARLGATVTFMDVVETNLHVVQKVCRHFGLTQVSFVHLKDFATLQNLPGRYDVIAAIGSLIHAPSDLIALERRAIDRHLKVGGRWLEFGYPQIRWVREGSMPFEKWGAKTDGESTPWVEWLDREKLLTSLLPSKYEVILDYNFHNEDFNWFDLVKVERESVSPSSGSAAPHTKGLEMSTPRTSYPVAVRHRDVANEPVAYGGGLDCFETPGARAINIARMDHLASLGLPLAGKTVLDVGCGPGHLAQRLLKLGAKVTCIDGRQENISFLRETYPGLTAHVGDVQTFPLASLGRFDAVLCYGLLYHLEDPVAGIRNVASACHEFVMLETLVCDSDQNLTILLDETVSANQALAAVGCRPSPGFVAMALNRAGFPFVYAPVQPPNYPDFLFDWRNNLDHWRDGHPIRCIFIASRTSFDHLPTLVRIVS